MPRKKKTPEASPSTSMPVHQEHGKTTRNQFPSVAFVPKTCRDIHTAYTREWPTNEYNRCVFVFIIAAILGQFCPDGKRLPNPGRHMLIASES
eukprot:4230313-Amphidinium_carterae.1